ncbi:MAG: CHAT domain-containing protein, partial [Candidatus Omnitrophica bacterium]|nr:CHAT domain-containing protein [Candidatus Omnitrophota bacterium]
MGHELWWSFGEPREEAGELVANFYYQIGKHVKLRLPWPTRRFADAGDLSIHVGNRTPGHEWPLDITSKTQETGRLLYELLGKDAQASLIRTFANPNNDSNHRTLHLLFPTPSLQNREICLTLEDLPWELLHDGEEFIAWRYSIQIIRAHPRYALPFEKRHVEIDSWGALLVTPFIFADREQCRQAGLEFLPQGIEEVKSIRSLQTQTHGMVLVGPNGPRRRAPGGVVAFRELEECLLGENAGRYHLIHFIGHGVIYDDEPCLCFESDEGGIDYVSVGRLRKLFLSILESSRNKDLPRVLFLNACSS